MSEKEDVLTENERLNLENAELKKNLEKANRFCYFLRQPPILSKGRFHF
jgi:hypothetical protein